jgi:hypothetical protein
MQKNDLFSSGAGGGAGCEVTNPDSDQQIKNSIPFDSSAVNV